MEHVVTAIFNNEKDAYRAFSELKLDLVNASCTITQMALVKKNNGRIYPCEQFDTGITTADDTHRGGLIGMIVGILAGPLGVLLGGSVGALIGTVIDSGDSDKNASMIERVSQRLEEGETAIIALVTETNTAMLDARLEPHGAIIIRNDAAEVALEVDEAKQVQKEMEAEAKAKMREAKKAERKQDIEEKRAKLRADFEAFKNKRSDQGQEEKAQN